MSRPFLSANARRFVLSDAETSTSAGEWSVSSAELAIATRTPFTIRQRLLHGGRQEGVTLIEVDNGKLQFAVIPTRGMSLLQGKCGGVTLGWNSPVKEIVNPAFVQLGARGGLGWLDGFNELLVRCGVEWAGHPGIDNGELLSLHGRIGNTPASKVVVVVDDQPPYRIHVRGTVVEQTFKFSDYALETDVSTEPGSASFRVSDKLVNRSDYEREFQIIYHSNFGPPLLESASRFVAPVKQVVPFNAHAARDLSNWTSYRGPSERFGEEVFDVVPYARADGSTTVMLHNASAVCGVRIDYNVKELPHFTLWKNTDTMKEGYVTGLEPGTGYPHPRSFERKHARVPTLAAGASRSFTIEYAVLSGAGPVADVVADIAKIQGNRPLQVDAAPENS